MLPKKFYLPIGILLVVICAVGLLSLRSDVPTEPIVIYKTTHPAAQEPAQVSVGDTSQDGHWHGEEWHADPHKPVEAIEGPPLLTSEFTRAELLERFPQYDFHSPESKENLHAILRNEKNLAEKEAQLAALKRKVAEQESAKELLYYVDSVVFRLETEYPDVDAFDEKYPDAQEEDFIREYTDETERSAFFERVLEAGKIRSEMAERILATPGIPEKLSSRHLEILHDVTNVVSIDEISAALELLRSQEVLYE